eukprot:snap_masked-scaffold_13-processed-gene-8.61-mRNA-1 protein AED:1.00 eAED:1.00 QI:0/0/0/0/1/1/3/0/108
MNQRQALYLHPNQTISYEIQDKNLIVKKISGDSVYKPYLFSTCLRKLYLVQDVELACQLCKNYYSSTNISYLTVKRNEQFDIHPPLRDQRHRNVHLTLNMESHSQTEL